MESVGQTVTPDTTTICDRSALTGTAAGRNLHRLERNVLLASSDAAMIFLSTALAYWSWAAPLKQQPAGIYLELAPLIVLFLAGYSRAGLYPSLGLGPVQTLRRLSYVTIFGFLVIAAFSFAFKLPHVYSRGTFLLACILSLVLVPIGRLALFSACPEVALVGRACRRHRHGTPGGAGHSRHQAGWPPRLFAGGRVDVRRGAARQ